MPTVTQEQTQLARADVNKRIGLYIKPKTRNRLNLFKAQLTIELGRVCSQDEAINVLLDSVSGGADHDNRQPA